MRVVFAGTGDIGLPTLKWLIESPEIKLLAVVCQPDMPVGRKQTLTAPATKRLAEEHGIPVRQPIKMRDDVDYFTTTSPDLIVVMAYGQILPKAILDAPKVACLNLHASILPRHRGASPIQAAIRDGDSESGVTVMYMDPGLDTGDVLLIHKFPLGSDETGGSLHDRIAELAPAALKDAVDQLSRGVAPRESQDADAATHCTKLTRSNGQIDWSQSAEQIERLIRAYAPWPGTTTQCTDRNSPISGKLLKIFPPTSVVNALEGDDCPPGTLVRGADSSLVVKTGNGLLEVESVQLEGKKRMGVGAFLKGASLAIGTRFGLKQ